MPQDVHDAADQGSSDPAPPPTRVDEQVFQFDGAAGLGPRGETGYRAVFLGDVGAALGQPLGRQDQAFRVGHQVVTVAMLDNDAR